MNRTRELQRRQLEYNQFVVIASMLAIGMFILALVLSLLLKSTIPAVVYFIGLGISGARHNYLYVRNLTDVQLVVWKKDKTRLPEVSFIIIFGSTLLATLMLSKSLGLSLAASSPTTAVAWFFLHKKLLTKQKEWLLR